MKCHFDYSIILAFILSIILTNVHIYGQSNDEKRGFIVEVGDKAPNIMLPLLTGDSISLYELRGKVVVLQFTASWCSVCRKEMPHLEKDVWLPNKNDDFVLIGVDIDEEVSKVAPFIEQMQITYPVAFDSNKESFHNFAVPKAGVTRNIIIDKKGNIAFLTRLFDPVEFEAMKSKIHQLLK